MNKNKQPIGANVRIEYSGEDDRPLVYFSFGKGYSDDDEHDEYGVPLTEIFMRTTEEELEEDNFRSFWIAKITLVYEPEDARG